MSLAAVKQIDFFHEVMNSCQKNDYLLETYFEMYYMYTPVYTDYTSMCPMNGEVARFHFKIFTFSKQAYNESLDFYNRS